MSAQEDWVGENVPQEDWVGETGRRGVAAKPESCGATNTTMFHRKDVCGRPKGHDGVHVAFYSHGVYAWGKP